MDLHGFHIRSGRSGFFSIYRGAHMKKFLGWTVGIIFLIGLLVVTGVLKLIF